MKIDRLSPKYWCFQESLVYFSISCCGPTPGLPWTYVIPTEKSYPISLSVPAGDPERFFLLVGANKSAKLTAKFKFYFDGEQLLESQQFELKVWRPANARINFVDCAQFVKHGDAWKLADEDGHADGSKWSW